MFFMLGNPLPALAIEYATIDYPGGRSTEINGIDGNNIVGLADTSRSVLGYLYDGSTYTTIQYPLAGATTVPLGISGSRVVGRYFNNDEQRDESFLWDGNTYTNIDDPDGVETRVKGINGQNIVGFYYDSSAMVHGFIYDGSLYTTLDHPDAYLTVVTGSSGNKIVGYYGGDHTAHGFVYDGSTFTDLDVAVPTLLYTFPSAIDGNDIVGQFIDIYNKRHAFFYDGTSYKIIDYPLAGPCPRGINCGSGANLGTYGRVDGVWRYFVKAAIFTASASFSFFPEEYR